MSEFDLIRRYFTRATPGAVLGVGDDAALLRINSGMELAVSADMLVSGTHFLPDADPFLLGHKTLAVNLSDMAAMGAQPRWATLALSLPQADEAWLQQFSAGFFALADQHGVELVGGDTTRGPLNLCVTILGEVPQGLALRRDGAQVGDDVWVSGKLGDAALALAHLQGTVTLFAEDFAMCATALHQPIPRVALGIALRGVAHSAIDVSDGLLADLGHVLECSRVGAEIRFDALPLSDVLRSLSGQDPSMSFPQMRENKPLVACFEERPSSLINLKTSVENEPAEGKPSSPALPPEGEGSKAPLPRGEGLGRGRSCAHIASPVNCMFSTEEFRISTLDSRIRGNDDYQKWKVVQHCALAGGDDYELCFTAPVARRNAVENISKQMRLPLSRIGAIVAGSGCIVSAADGSVINMRESGYDHFA